VFYLCDSIVLLEYNLKYNYLLFVSELLCSFSLMFGSNTPHANALQQISREESIYIVVFIIVYGYKVVGGLSGD